MQKNDNGEITLGDQIQKDNNFRNKLSEVAKNELNYEFDTDSEEDDNLAAFKQDMIKAKSPPTNSSNIIDKLMTPSNKIETPKLSPTLISKSYKYLFY